MPLRAYGAATPHADAAVRRNHPSRLIGANFGFELTLRACESFRSRRPELCTLMGLSTRRKKRALYQSENQALARPSEVVCSHHDLQGNT